ncbi:F-box/LRR-repeat protein 3-like [Rosa sericea]
MGKELGRIPLLCHEELGLILTKLSDPGDRKTFSQVCKEWFQVEALHRSSLRLLRHQFLRQVLPRFPNLLTFETSEPVTDTDVEFLAQTCPQLETIDLTTSGHKPFSLLGFGLVVVANRCPKLSKVLLKRRRSITDPVIVSLIKLAPNLAHLDLGGCYNISDRALKAIGCCGSLSYLDLESCGFTDRGLGFLANGSCSKTLKTLILAWCKGITDVGVSSLQKMQCLEHLNLSNSSRHKITDIGGVAISAIKTLKKLNLAALAKLSNRTVAALAQNCPNLEVLDISECRLLTGVGIRAFSGHVCLETIVLHRLHQVSASDLEHLVLGCPSLKSILLHGEESLSKILPLMRESTRRLVRMGSAFPTYSSK